MSSGRHSRRASAAFAMLTAATIALTTMTMHAAPALAQGRRCQDLWIERNSIYKERGYCFKTERAIRYFGNDGCSYDDEADVPLSRSERARIAQIRRLEREFGCD